MNSKGLTGGLILAAGTSSRMGRFKPMLPVEDTTFIKRIIRLFKAAGTDRICVVTGYRAEELEEHIRDEDVICVRNERFFETDMLASVKLGIKEMYKSCGSILMTPVDVCMMSEGTCRLIAESGAEFARPVYKDRRGHPVLIGKSFFDRILDYQGEGGVRAAIGQSAKNIIDMDVEDEAVILDADTCDDYRRVLGYAERLAGHSGRVRPEIDIGFASSEFLCSESFMQLMELIKATGSIQKASFAMHMSYTKAWKLIKHIEDRTSIRLIERASGGEDGGRSFLTDAGEDFLHRYREMRRELDREIRLLTGRYFGDLYL